MEKIQMSNVQHRASEGHDRRPLTQDSFDESLLDAAGSTDESRSSSPSSPRKGAGHERNGRNEYAKLVSQEHSDDDDDGDGDKGAAEEKKRNGTKQDDTKPEDAKVAETTT
ncbi:hypothetical protein PC116_g32821 [Phytophthora cactorum]|nr:hypothetical protein PC116_g32821 [Phytophthora cactorum]